MVSDILWHCRMIYTVPSGRQVKDMPGQVFENLIVTSCNSFIWEKSNLYYAEYLIHMPEIDILLTNREQDIELVTTLLGCGKVRNSCVTLNC